MNDVTYGSGSQDDPWKLKTPSLSSEFEVWKDSTQNPPALVVQVGTTRLSYQLRALDDAYAMLKAHGGWMALGNADDDLPLVFHPAATGARWSFTPVGAG